jgi:adenosylcobinamide-phosphate synthase
MTEILFAVLFAVALDRFVPATARVQLWNWYTDWAESIELRFNGGSRRHGVSAVALALVPILLVVLVARYLLGELAGVLRFAFDVGMLYLCLDLYRLTATSEAISTALEGGELDQAAGQLRSLTGKETVEKTEAGIAHATVEAVLKLANSVAIAPIFWFILFGPFGVVLQRLASVLDRLWGHRNRRFAEFGWAAARLDDVLGWIPARITALSYAIMGSFEDALHCWRRRAGMWSDINSGPLLASGLGAMHMDNCEDLEEDAYGNRVVSPSTLADAGDVRRVVALVWRVLLFWLMIGVLMAGAHLAGLFKR